MNLKFIDFWFLYFPQIILNCLSLESEIDKRVFDASRAQRGNFPFVGRLDFLPFQDDLIEDEVIGQCTVNLLNEETIITSAHCFCQNKTLNVYPILYSVTFGSVDENDTKFTQESMLSRIFIHPTYLAAENKCEKDATSYAVSDVALAKLATLIEFDQFVKPIKLSPKNYAVNTSIIHVGYGDNSETDEVILTYGSSFIRGLIDRSYVSCVKCHFYQSVGAQGDSGGPMLVQDENGETVLGGVLYASTNITTYYVASDKIYDWANSYDISYNTPMQATGRNFFSSKFSKLKQKVLKWCGKYKYKYTVNQC